MEHAVLSHWVGPKQHLSEVAKIPGCLGTLGGTLPGSEWGAKTAQLDRIHCAGFCFIFSALYLTISFILLKNVMMHPLIFQILVIYYCLFLLLVSLAIELLFSNSSIFFPKEPAFQPVGFFSINFFLYNFTDFWEPNFSSKYFAFNLLFFILIYWGKILDNCIGWYIMSIWEV